MGWFRIDDKAIDNHKLLALSDGAFRLWVEGGLHCNRQLTDGLIHRLALAGFRYVTRKRVEELAVTLWEPHPDGFMMRDFLQWNESKADVVRKREEAKVRANFARTSRARALNPPLGEGITSPRSSSQEEEREARERDFDTFWAVYPRKDGRAAAVKAFYRLDPDATLRGAILAALERQKRQPQWTKDDGQFVPYAATWLNGRRWEDQGTAGPVLVGSARDMSWMDECEQIHNRECGNEWRHDQRKQLDAMKAERAS